MLSTRTVLDSEKVPLLRSIIRPSAKSKENNPAVLLYVMNDRRLEYLHQSDLHPLDEG